MFKNTNTVSWVVLRTLLRWILLFEGKFANTTRSRITIFPWILSLSFKLNTWVARLDNVMMYKHNSIVTTKCVKIILSMLFHQFPISIWMREYSVLRPTTYMKHARKGAKVDSKIIRHALIVGHGTSTRTRGEGIWSTLWEMMLWVRYISSKFSY